MIRKETSNGWSRFKYLVFDAPHLTSGFEDRYAYLKSSIPSGHPFVKVVEMIKCKDKNHLDEFLNEVTSHQGEGVMLRQPESSYQYGRSSTLQKYKVNCFFFLFKYLLVQKRYLDEAIISNPLNRECTL
jgi:DNA ligase-1